MKKSIIIILIIVSLYLLIAIFGLGLLDSLMNKYLYIDNVGFKYSNGKWNNIKISKDILKKYEIYLPNTFEHIGKYNIKYDNKWYYGNKGLMPYDEVLFAYKGNNIKIYEYKTNYGIYDTKIKEFLEENNLTYEELNLEKEISIDLDNNGENDVIYALSNVYSSKDEKVLFSAIIVKINKEYSILKTILDDDEVMLDIFAIMDINNDKKLELIINEQGFSLNGNTYSIYGIKNGKYTELIKA